MIRSDPVAEWKACGVLRQSDLDGLIATGIPILALAGDVHDGGFCVCGTGSWRTAWHVVSNSPVTTRRQGRPWRH